MNGIKISVAIAVVIVLAGMSGNAAASQPQAVAETTFKATESTAKTAPKIAPTELIGLETNGPFYPDGWKQVASTGFGKSLVILTTLRRGKQYAMLLERQTNMPKPGERIRSVVTDAISLRNAISYHQTAHLCYAPGQEPSKTTANYLAEVGFAKYCDMKTTLIYRAWKINLQTGKFDVVPSTKGMVCEFGYISIGEPD